MSSSADTGEQRTPGSQQIKRRSRRITIAALLLAATGVALLILAQGRNQVPLGLLRADPATPQRPPELPPLWEHFESLTVTQQLTGPGSPNRTYQRWNVGGTDLGHTFFHKGDLYMVFGDTYGRAREDWRSNTMAKITALDSPSTGLEFESFVGETEGRATELLSSHKVYWVEPTVIPTNGISLGERMALHYMSVRRWVAPGRWVINHAGIAYSDDDGLTWSRSGEMWGRNSNFAQVSFVRNPEDPGRIYLLGIPAGRQGAVKVARVPEQDLLDIGSYRYWNGRDWTAVESRAAAVVPAPVGELSVAWNDYLDSWVMMYLSEPHRAIVVRTAEELTGPWSDERLITTGRDHPQLYAPFIIPFDSTQPEIFFTMSRWDAYNVFLMHLRLQ
ncbi:MAG: DUF4185 domain-containing protein [Actinomycetota bacterium]